MGRAVARTRTLALDLKLAQCVCVCVYVCVCVCVVGSAFKMCCKSAHCMEQPVQFQVKTAGQSGIWLQP